MDKLLEYWFPDKLYQNFWFDGKRDQEIGELFGSILIQYENETVCVADLSIEEKLGRIILFDQITRHVYRRDVQGTSGEADVQETSVKLFQKNDSKALSLALNIIETQEDLNLSMCRRVFVLLPLRHNKSLKYLNIVMEKIHQYHTKLNRIEETILSKFINATLKDFAINTESIEAFTDKLVINKDNWCMNHLYKSILDANCYIFCDDVSSSIVSLFNQELKSFFSKNPLNRIIVSLSGGVDSMVLLDLCIKLKGPSNVIAVHLDYANRDESQLEAEFIQEWCQLQGVVFYKRRIDHVKRGVFEILTRNIYEEHTKQIRFGLYKHVMQLHGISAVCLGHNADDVSENVFTNIMKGRNLSDISVICEKSIIDNVSIYRPMHAITKDNIFKYASIYRIPYFKNTTPEWSNRGILRNQIFPLLEKQYGSSFTKHLFLLGRQAAEMTTLIDKNVLDPILKKIEFQSETTCFISDIDVNLPDCIWHPVLLKCIHGLRHRMISHKSFHDFIVKLRGCVGKECVFTLSKNLTAVITHEKTLFFFKNNNIL
jgi:tRNA(Ile)-lysidine synthetase-like protein